MPPALSTFGAAEAHISTAVSGPVARLRSRALQAHRRSAARRTHRDLLACEDHVLKDIGLSRSDLRRAMQE